MANDFHAETGFSGFVAEHLRKLRVVGRLIPPRFFGYYFQGNNPICVAGSWVVTLDAVEPVTLIPAYLKKAEEIGYFVVSQDENSHPPHILVHDRHDGMCTLWPFEEGMDFIQATEPTWKIPASGESSEVSEESP